jgi:hypothetical protein
VLNPKAFPAGPTVVFADLATQRVLPVEVLLRRLGRIDIGLIPAIGQEM